MYGAWRAYRAIHSPRQGISGEFDERIGGEEVAALLRVVRVAVGAAVAAAVLLSFMLVRYRSLDYSTGFRWTFYISVCAGAHLVLRGAYVRSQTQQSRWRVWGNVFAGICLAEGLGWGWASVMLTQSGGLDAQFLTLLVTQAMAAGSIPAFGRYLPAFLCLFVPTTAPYLFVSLLSTNGLERSSGLLMGIYILGMGTLGFATNRQFRQLTMLRLQTDQLAAELLKQRDIADEASRAKTSFLAAASHDLRQPVHALGLFVGALKTIKMPPEAMRLIEQIDNSSQAMDGLFAALLDISRLDAGVVEVRERRFSIDSILQRIHIEYSAEAAAKSLQIAYMPCSVYVCSDPILLERVLRNLVSNAVRYTKTGRILIGCRRRAAGLIVQVFDTGIGISVDQQDQIFHEYYQIGNSERDRTRGLGLGLAIVRRLTRLLNVPVLLRSELGRGSCFEIHLRIAEPLPGVHVIRPDVREVPTIQGRLIVVIDDEAPIRAAMLSLLTSWGHHVFVAGSGDEVIAVLADHPMRPDLIICDLRLRGGEMGTAVIERLRTEYNAEIPAILVTGDTAPHRLEDAHASGLLLLHKPVSNGRLRAALSNVIAGAEVVTSDLGDMVP